MASSADRPWLSILLPVYNVAPYLEECLASILDQVDAGVEVIALDDASTDDSRALLEAINCRTGQRIRILVHAANEGPGAARNHLLQAATGTHIWFVDSDDQLAPGAIAAARAVFERDDPDLLLCGHLRQIDGTAHEPRFARGFAGPARRLLTDRATIVHGMFRSRTLYAWSCLFRRSIHPEAELFPGSICCEDVHSTARLCLRARSLYYEPSGWVIYRTRAGSIMRSLDRKKASDLVGALAGLNGEFARAVAPMPFGTRVAVAEFCAHLYLMGCRHLARLDWAYFAQHKSEFDALFRGACPLTPFELLRGFLARPRDWRYGLRLWLWLHAPRAAARLRM